MTGTGVVIESIGVINTVTQGGWAATSSNNFLGIPDAILGVSVTGIFGILVVWLQHAYYLKQKRFEKIYQAQLSGLLDIYYRIKHADQLLYNFVNPLRQKSVEEKFSVFANGINEALSDLRTSVFKNIILFDDKLEKKLETLLTNLYKMYNNQLELQKLDEKLSVDTVTPEILKNYASIVKETKELFDKDSSEIIKMIKKDFRNIFQGKSAKNTISSKRKSESPK